MKAYKGEFIKKSGETRKMVVSRIKDLPSDFVASKIVGAGSETKYPKGMELVWDLEVDNFRIFNWNTLSSPVEESEVEETIFS